MDETKIKNLNKLLDLVSLAQSNYVSPDEVVGVVEAILGVVDKLQKDLTAKIDSTVWVNVGDVEDLKDKMAEVEKSLKSILENTKTNELEQKLKEEVGRLESLLGSIKLDESFSEQLNGLELSIEELKSKNLSAEEVRDKLEKLKGDDRLDVSAIKGFSGRLSKLADDVVNRAVSILDNRTSFLINKVSNLQTLVERGASGVSTFLGLSDTPSSYAGQSGKVPAVKATEDGLEFIAVSGSGTVTEVTSADANLTVATGTTTPVLTIVNAPTATALETARTIGGTSFDGTANIVPATITVADTADATSFVALFESATGDLAPKTDAGLTYAADTGTLTSTIINTPTLTLTGTGTLNGLDAIDATTEATIEAAIDTLANLTSVQGLTVTLADAGADAVLGWDDSASAYQNLSAADVRTAIGLASGNSPQFTAIELNHASANTLTASGGHMTIEGATVWDSGNDGASSGLDADLLDGKNTGTSGNTVPLLDGTNTWSGQQTISLGSAATTEPLRLVNTTDNASVQVAQFEGDRATMADNDEAYVSLLLSNDGGTQTEFGRLSWVATDVNAGTSVDGRLDFAVATAGSLADELSLDGTKLFPSTSDGLALGDGTNMWADLFLASGGVINFNNGNATLTHSTGLLTSNVPVSLGTSNAFTCGTIELGHASANTLSASGGVLSVEGVVIPSISSTNTLTNKRVTPRTGTTTSSTTPTINTDNVDFYSITALAGDITSMTTNLSGTPTDGQKLWIAITGTAARAITWGSSFESSTVTLPTTTVTTNRLDVGFVWNAVTSKWRCVAKC